MKKLDNDDWFLILWFFMLGFALSAIIFHNMWNEYFKFKMHNLDKAEAIKSICIHEFKISNDGEVRYCPKCHYREWNI